MEDHRLTNCSIKREGALTIFENEVTITCILLSRYQANTVHPLLSCIDSGAPQSFVGKRELGGIRRHPERRFIPILDSKCDFKIYETLVIPRGLVELMLHTSKLFFHLSDKLYDSIIKISASQRLEIPDRNNFLRQSYLSSFEPHN